MNLILQIRQLWLTFIKLPKNCDLFARTRIFPHIMYTDHGFLSLFFQFFRTSPPIWIHPILFFYLKKKNSLLRDNNKI